MGVIELSPDLNSEYVLTTGYTLVEEANARKHLSIFECVSDDAEYELFPDLLQEWQVGSEVDLEFAAVLVDVIFPLGLYPVLEQAHATDTHGLTFH